MIYIYILQIENIIILKHLVSFNRICFIFLNISSAQEPCNTPEDEDYSTIIDSIEGPIIVKVYFHLLRTSEGSGGISFLQLEETMDFIDQIYGPHDISFNYCVEEIHDTDLYNSIKNSFSGVGPYLNDNAIDAFIHDQGGGRAAGIPATYFMATNNKDNIAHELGHALGLSHTFSGGCWEDAPIYDNDTFVDYGANSHTSGDRVYDTPADIYAELGNSSCNPNNDLVKVETHDCLFNNVYGTVDSNGNLYRDIEDPNNPGSWYLAHNIMSYYAGCHALITPGQNGRIRKKMTSNSMQMTIQDELKPIVFNYAKDGHEVKIYEPINWYRDRIIDGNVRVTSGGELSFVSGFHGFTPDHGIIANSGSTINIDGSFLKVRNLENNCAGPYSGYTWNGITLENISAFSEKVTISILDSYIDDAETALKCAPLGPAANADIEISGSIFRNNHRAIDVYGLHDTNLLTINDSKFWYYGSDHFADHISHFKINNSTAHLNNVEIENFNSNVGNGTDEAFYGLESFNSNIMIKKARIKGWKYGIFKEDKIKYLDFSVFNSQINNNSKYGIYSTHKSEGFEVNGCNLTKNNIYGIFLDKDAWSYIEIMNNEFGHS